ncbi:MAG TPA: hypothetical protein PK156_16430 [Polyangium sp.]|nr:hypothetical protein [Polyangium sp.]
MRISSLVMALGSSTIMALFLWASGCTTLTDDCKLNLDCPTEVVTKPNCAQTLFPGECDACLQNECCQELADCSTNSTCLNICIKNLLPYSPECTTVAANKTLLDGFTSCMMTKCSDKCPPPDGCNPVTHNGCTFDGSSCDFVYPGRWDCYGAVGTPAAICQPCDFYQSPYCGSGLHCHPASKQCARYCCSDADCGTGHCELDPMIAFGADVVRPDNLVGICLTMANDKPSCDAPLMPMSTGDCFKGYPPK